MLMKNQKKEIELVLSLQVFAMDRDEGANGRVRYSIALGDDNRDFTISEDTGVIRVAKNLNFERKSRYHLTIRGEDCASEVGETPRGDTAQVTITVLDINDNAPVFLDSPYLAHVMENMVPPGGGFVIQVCLMGVRWRIQNTRYRLAFDSYQR